MRKIVLTFGLIAGAILSAMMLITLPFHDQIGFDKGAIIGYTTMVLAFLMVFFGVKSYRDNVAGGSVTFGRGFMVGLLITAVASVCYVATWEVIYHRFAPDYVEKYGAYAVEKMRKSGASDAEILAKTKEMAEFNELYKNPLVNIAYIARAIAGRNPVHARDGRGAEPEAAVRGRCARIAIYCVRLHLSSCLRRAIPQRKTANENRNPCSLRHSCGVVCCGRTNQVGNRS